MDLENIKLTATVLGQCLLNFLPVIAATAIAAVIIATNHRAKAPRASVRRIR